MTETITVKSIEQKIDKGEALTPEENTFIMSLPPGGADAQPGPDEKEIDWSEAENADKPKVKTPEQKKADDEKAMAAKKKQDQASKAKSLGLSETATEQEITAAETKKQQEDDAKDPLVKIEVELQKPEGQEDLSGFSPREKAYFFQMRKDRKSRQKAEEDRDAALFREVQLKKKTEKAPEAAPADPLAELKKKEPTDFMTVADVLKVIEGVKAAPAKTEEAAPAGPSPAQMRYFSLCDKEAAAEHPEDYAAVMDLTDEIINSNPEHLKQVAEAIKRGDNPAEKTYQLIKGDPEFAKLFPVAQTRVAARKKKPDAVKTPEEIAKESKAQEAQDKLEQNKNKSKTTGHVSGSEEVDHSAGYTDGKVTYTSEQLMRMSDFQFARLPKKIRDAFLKDNGS